MTPQDRAHRVGRAMWDRDAASHWLGLRLDEIAPGRAVLSLIVEDRHVNGTGICHGGFIFTLADSAFAYACNSRNRVTVAQQNQISYLSPGQLGETLRAEAAEAAVAGRSGIYDVTVTGGDGRIVALFRGLSRSIEGQHFEEPEGP